MTTISVVIPTRNDADMLAVCLAALARQTRPADEIVVEFKQEGPFRRRRRRRRWERGHPR